MTIRLFFDSSALFAAAYSSSGGARELIRMAILGQVQIVISQDVLDESLRNLQRKAPQKIFILEQLLEVLELEIIDSPTPTEAREAEGLVVQKDAIILAAVKNANVSFFVTLDKKHLLGNPALVVFTGKSIGSPQEALAFVREKTNQDIT
jgi:predicted nucleic acid-binding protein